MLELGKIQKLKAVKKVEFGMYFCDPQEPGKDAPRVLLPIKQVPQGLNVGDELALFLYKDSSDRLIATTKTPMITLGEFAVLTVVGTSKIGAFLDWGLEKDLFLPFKEQTFRVREHDRCLVALYIDKSSRLCATMKVYHYLDKNSPYAKDDWVEGTIYEISDNFGAFVAVDDRYSALIPKREYTKDIPCGSRVRARVTEVLEDGKLTLSIREKAYIQIAQDAKKVYETIESFDGVLPFNDKASPETIKRELGMSKNEFKRAVGNLLKAGKIEITDHSIRLTGR